MGKEGQQMEHGQRGMLRARTHAEMCAINNTGCYDDVKLQQSRLPACTPYEAHWLRQKTKKSINRATHLQSLGWCALKIQGDEGA
jgi:hypothetical protein